MTPETLWNALRMRAQESPSIAAIRALGRDALTYGELARQVEEAVETLTRLGFQPKDRIAVALPEGPECPAALISVMAGFICVPLNPAYSEEECSAALRQAGVKALITRAASLPDAALAAKNCGIPVVELEYLPEEPAGRFTLQGRSRRPGVDVRWPGTDAVAVIFSTSGSTSTPKLIPLTHGMVCDRARRARHSVDLTAADVCLDLIPSFHGGAIRVSILGTLFAGASGIYPGTLAPADLDRTIRELKTTWCALPPPYLTMLLAQETAGTESGAWDGLRAFFTTGAPVSPEVVAQVEERFGLPLQNYYGAAECGGIAVNPMPPGLRKRGSVGISIGPELMLLDEHGRPVAPGRVGEVLVRGPGVFRGYEYTDRGSRKQPSPFMREWYRTGDRGYQDEDGYLFLTGRIGNTINRGGEKISPEEIEQVLRRYPSVQDAVVFSAPHDDLGQEVMALVVPKPEARINLLDLRQFASGHILAAKVPRVVLVVDEIPLGPAGKVQRGKLADQFAEDILRARQTREREYVTLQSALENGLAIIWQRVLKTEAIGTTDRFFDLGGTSLHAANMFAEVERGYGRSVPLTQFWQEPTIGNLAKLLLTAEPLKTSMLLPICKTGVNPALFYILPGWYLAEAESISRHIGADQPFYALVPDPRPNGNQAGMSKMEIVMECATEIEAVQPEGPILLVGRSIGGLVAIDVAHELRRRNRTVALLALVDSRYPDGETIASTLEHLQALTVKLASVSRTDTKRHLRFALGYLRRLPRKAAGAGWKKLRGKQDVNQAETDAFYTNMQKLFYEEPQRWPGRIVLFAAELSRYRGAFDTRWLWSKKAEQGLEVHLVPGTHDLMVLEPHVRRLSAVLRACVQRALQEAAHSGTAQQPGAASGDPAIMASGR